MNTFRTIFKKISAWELPAPALEGRILAAIAAEIEQRIKAERRAAYVGMALSAVVASVAGLGYGSELIRSDFWNIVSLIFSDTSALAGYWDSFLYSLLETFPVSAAIAFILPAFIFLVSLGMYSQFRRDADQRQFIIHAS